MTATELGAVPALPLRDVTASPTPACPASEEEMRRRTEAVLALVAWHEAHDRLTWSNPNDAR